MNNFIAKKLQNALKKASSDVYKKYVIAQFKLFDDIGISNEESLLKFHYLSQYIPKLAENIGISDYKNLLKYAFANINLQQLSEENIINVVSSYFNKYIVKQAYPNPITDGEPLTNYDINKWIKARNEIIIKGRVYGNRYQIMNNITSKWSDMQEKIDFEKWMKFYDQNANNLYKSAQELPLQYIPGLTQNKPSEKMIDENEIVEEKPDMDNIRAKIIGRINSAKRMLTSKEGRNFAGDSYSKLLEMLLNFEKDLFNIKTACMLEDIIYRAKNGLAKNGCDQYVCDMFMKIAQLPPLPDPTATPPGAPTPAPTQPSATPTGTKEDGEKAIGGFIDELQEIYPIAKEIKKPELKKSEEPKPETDKTKTEPTKQENVPAKKAANWAIIETPEFLNFEKIANNIYKLMINAADHLHDISKIAQEVTPDVAAPKVIPAPTSAVKEVVEKQDTSEPVKKEPELTDFQKEKENPLLFKMKTPKDSKIMGLDTDVIDNALQNISISDVVVRLQAIAKVFKNREVARQLGIIDLMLDKLGIAGFFPSLAEATRSALESNQYCQTRIEEILSKLRSATDSYGKTLLSKNVDNMIDKEMDEYLKEADEAKKIPAAPITQKQTIPPTKPVAI